MFDHLKMSVSSERIINCVFKKHLESSIIVCSDVDFCFPLRRDRARLHVVGTTASKKGSSSYVLVLPSRWRNALLKDGRVRN